MFDSGDVPEPRDSKGEGWNRKKSNQMRPVESLSIVMKRRHTLWKLSMHTPMNLSLIKDRIIRNFLRDRKDARQQVKPNRGSSMRCSHSSRPGFRRRFFLSARFFLNSRILRRTLRGTEVEIRTGEGLERSSSFFRNRANAICLFLNWLRSS